RLLTLRPAPASTSAWPPRLCWCSSASRLSSRRPRARTPSPRTTTFELSSEEDRQCFGGAGGEALPPAPLEKRVHRAFVEGNGVVVDVEGDVFGHHRPVHLLRVGRHIIA